MRTAQRGLLHDRQHQRPLWIGLFRPTKPKTKLIQNITQSNEIKFGDALESIFEKYFKKIGFEILTKTYKLSGRTLKIDQLIKKSNTIYLIEQKIRANNRSKSFFYTIHKGLISINGI